MSFLQKLLEYEKVCIQCHNDPDADAIASAFGVYTFLKANNKDAFIVYGGQDPIKRNALCMMVEECNIPIEQTHKPKEFDVLVMVDCQYGRGNTEVFPADNVLIIDHHPWYCPENENHFIDSNYQSCSTMVWEMLVEEGIKIDAALSSLLLYGLYTDTALFSDLYSRKDTEMKMELYNHQPLFEKLAKSSMTLAELMVASEAINNHIMNFENRFAIVQAISCEQTLLGTIGDFIIQADVISLCFCYTLANNGYRISIRSCDDKFPANEVAKFVCEGIGSGGGHHNKAGGYINKDEFEEKYGKRPSEEIMEEILSKFAQSIKE